MTSAYEASLPTLLKYFEEDLFKEFGVTIDDETYHTFIRFYKFIKENFKNNPNFIRNSSDLDKQFKTALTNKENITVVSRLDDESNLTYFKTQTKHFDFIIKIKNDRKRIIKNYRYLSNEIDNKKTLTALKANLVHFVDAMLIRDINTSVFYFSSSMYISIHDSFMVDFTEVSEFILLANKCINNDPFKTT